ncbi:TIR-like protein FxsC [Micromonospora sp. WMMD729]|uniref:TIR-like protein FxsC n=1 Tax=Micromonospora sp. WMMD729 TaxID=3404127 RepID=UPI003BF51B25
MLYFYLSYARGDDDALVNQFYEDLNAEVRLIAGLSRDPEVGFVDRTLLLGETWSERLSAALSTCRTFVVLSTPRYYLSDVCGREWSVFSSRLRQVPDERRQASSRALVVLPWIPHGSERVPEIVRPFRSSNLMPEFVFDRVGVRQLMRLKRHHDAYLDLLDGLAHRIVAAAEQFPVPDTAFFSVASAPNAFQPDRKSPVGSSTGRDALTVVQAAFTAAGRPLDETGLPGMFTPGPVWVVTDATASASELPLFNEYARHGRLSYLVHADALRSDVERGLDRLRLEGKPVVTVSLRALRAALTDGRAKPFLDELERRYGTRDNLFDTKNALTDERFLFGREAMLNTIGSAIKRDEHVLITGLRKVGKTSLLNILRQHLVDQPVCMVDLQRFDRHTEDWPAELSRLMIEAFDRWGRLEQVDWPFTTSTPATVSELERQLHARIDHVGRSIRLTVVLDEIERVFPEPDEIGAARRWVRASGALRLLAQGDRRTVVVIGADLRPVANRINDLGPAGTNPLFSFFQEIPLPLLDADALTEMVHTLAREMGVREVTTGFTERLFRLSGGHPSLARTIAAESYRRRRDATLLTDVDLDAGLDHLEESDAVGYVLRNNLWDFLTPQEREVLEELARPRPTPRYRTAERSQAEATLRRQGLVTDQRIRIGLFEKWILDRVGGGRW